MSEDQAGQLAAILTAVVWAGALVLFKRSGERVPPLALNLFKNAVGLVCLAVHLVGIGLWTKAGFDPFQKCDPVDVFILVFSGIVGIAVADTLFFHALNLVGVGIVSIVDCTYSPFVILFSWLLLFEHLTASLLVGAALILAGVLISSRHAPPGGRTAGQLVLGTLLATASMGLMAIGIVMATPVLKSLPVVWATAVRLLAGTVCLAAMAAASPQRREIWAVFRPTAVWKFSVPGAFLGTYVSLVLWVAGFKYAEKASAAAILNQTSVIFAIILATVWLKEQFTLRKAVAVVLAMSGVAFVTFDLVGRWSGSG